MSKYYNYFVLNYTDETTNKKRAHVLQFGKLNNLISIYKDFQTITNTKGEKATLNIIHLAKNKKDAFTTCENWNDIYKKEQLHFDI